MIMKKYLAATLSVSLLTAGFPGCAHKSNNENTAAKAAAEGTPAPTTTPATVVVEPTVQQKAEDISNAASSKEAADKAASNLNCDPKTDKACEVATNKIMGLSKTQMTAATVAVVFVAVASIYKARNKLGISNQQFEVMVDKVIAEVNKTPRYLDVFVWKAKRFVKAESKKFQELVDDVVAKVKPAKAGTVTPPATPAKGPVTIPIE